MQQRARLFPYSASAAAGQGIARRGQAPVLFRRYAAFDRHQTGIGPAFPAAVEQTHVFHPGVPSRICAAGGGVDVATVRITVVSLTNALFRQQCFQLGIGDLIPQRFAFDLVGVDISGAREYDSAADRIWARPGGFNHFHCPAGAAVTALPCWRSCSHCG